MIILDNNGFQNSIYLEKTTQIIGSQTWIHEYPSGLSARCHQYEGFSVEELQIDPGPISFAQKYLLKSYDSFDDYNQIYAIKEAWNNNVAYKTFTELEWRTLLSKGFLGVLGIKCPELLKNKTFIFYTKLDKKIRDLENSFRGRIYSDILAEIRSHLDIEGVDNLWHVINDIYTKYIVWVKDFQNGKGGIREDYLYFLEIENQIKSNSTLQKTYSSKNIKEIIYDEH